LKEFLSTYKDLLDANRSASSSEEAMEILKETCFILKGLYCSEHWDYAYRNPEIRDTGSVDELANSKLIKVQIHQRTLRPPNVEFQEFFDEIFYIASALARNYDSPEIRNGLLEVTTKSPAYHEQRDGPVKRSPEFYYLVRKIAKQNRQKKIRRKGSNK
jgi:hypothetical protein